MRLREILGRLVGNAFAFIFDQLVESARERYAAGQITRSDVLLLADLLEGAAQQLRSIVGEDDVIARVKRRMRRGSVIEEVRSDEVEGSQEGG